MSLLSVRADLAARAPDLTVLDHEVTTATVADAAAAHGVAPGQIAKTLALRVAGRDLLLVVAGDARLDNRKARAALGGKASLLGPDEVAALTGHPVGGVCPFGLATPLPVYCDITLRRFDQVIPAAGSTHASVIVAPDRLAALADATWIDACATAVSTAPAPAEETS